MKVKRNTLLLLACLVWSVAGFNILRIGLASYGAYVSITNLLLSVALCTTGLENYTTSLGMGKWITSVTMTIFYVLLYYVWRRRYQVQGGSGLTAGVYLLAILRIVLCMMPQNQWLSANPPLSWASGAIFPLRFWALSSLCCFIAAPKAMGTGLSGGCG